MSAEIDKAGKTVESKVAAKPKLDPKDPLRPRRKKARRACFACQRAHLTCGDERPCQRCIKRGLADACQDGVRKKAKYLHDVPREALSPVLGPNYNQVNNSSNNGYSTASTSTSDTLIEPSSSPFYPTPSTNPLLLQAGLIQPESFNFDLEGVDSVVLGFGMLGDMGTSNGVFGNNAGMTANVYPCVPRRTL